MARSNKSIYSDFILEEINKGNFKYSEVFSLFLPKFGTTRQTFDKYWKIANKAHSEARQAIEKEKLATTIKEEKEAVKRDILTKAERMEIASNIARGKTRTVRGVMISPTDSERIRALDYLSRIEGDYVPVEQNHSVSYNLPPYMNASKA